MRKPIQRILIILILIILLPSLFFSVYEITNINENEEVVEDIYNKQLEAILFSINQYAEDVTRSWMEEFNAKISNSDDKENTIYAFLEDKKQVNSVFCAKNLEGDGLEIWINRNEGRKIEKTQIIGLFKENKPKLGKLFVYMKGNYRKIEPIVFNQNYLLFIIGNKPEDYKICGFQVDPQKFIAEVLSPRIQYTGEEKFLISVSQVDESGLVYYSNLDTTVNKNAQLKEEIWLFPA